MYPMNCWFSAMASRMVMNVLWQVVCGVGGCRGTGIWIWYPHCHHWLHGLWHHCHQHGALGCCVAMYSELQGVGGLGQVRGVARLGCQGLSLVGGHCYGCHSVWWNLGDLYHWHWCWCGLEVVGNIVGILLLHVDQHCLWWQENMEIVGWGCTVVLWLGFGVVVIVALLLLSVMSSVAVLAAVATCTKVSKRVFGAMELLSSVMFVIVV